MEAVFRDFTFDFISFLLVLNLVMLVPAAMNSLHSFNPATFNEGLIARRPRRSTLRLFFWLCTMAFTAHKVVRSDTPFQGLSAFFFVISLISGSAVVYYALQSWQQKGSNHG